MLKIFDMSWNSGLYTRMRNLSRYLIPVLFLTGCAVGPLATQETGRTVGASQNDLSGGYGQSGYVFKWSHGFGEAFDLGVQFEQLSLGLRAKYGWIQNRDRGFSLATAAGAGASVGSGTHYYGDLIASYLVDQFEPYTSFRFTHVNVDVNDFINLSGPADDFTIPGSSYNYGMVFIGSRYWFNSSWYLSAEGATFVPMTAGLSYSTHFLANASLGFHF